MGGDACAAAIADDIDDPALLFGIMEKFMSDVEGFVLCQGTGGEV